VTKCGFLAASRENLSNMEHDFTKTNSINTLKNTLSTTLNDATVNNIVNNEQLLSQLRRTHNTVTTPIKFHTVSNGKFNSINKYAYERLSSSSTAPDIWNKRSKFDEHEVLNTGEHVECKHMNFIHQINCAHHRRQYPVILQQQRNITSTLVDNLQKSEEEMAEIRAAQHDLTVIDEYMEKAGKANVALTSADIKHNIDWLLAEAKRERDGEFTSMDAYNRLYSHIPLRQPTFDQVNEETVAMKCMNRMRK
jgi:hypothetical protein